MKPHPAHSAPARTTPEGITLRADHIAILQHATRPESKDLYVGGSYEMTCLVAAGYMKNIGRPSYCPDNFYQITPAGKSFLAFYSQTQSQRETSAPHSDLPPKASP